MDAVTSQFVPFWVVTGITGGLIVASAVAYQEEIRHAYGKTRAWLLLRKPETHSSDIPKSNHREDSFPVWLIKFAGFMVVFTLLVPPGLYVFLNGVALSFGLWMWIFGDVPTLVDGFDRAWEGLSDGV